MALPDRGRLQKVVNSGTWFREYVKIAVRLPEFGMKPPLKCSLMDANGRRIVPWIGLRYLNTGKRPVLIMPVFRSPAGSRGCPDRTGSPAQDYDQLQCLRIFPHPGVPTATDGNSPHTRVCLTPQNDETMSYSGKTKS
jgi:hypothetical protein